MDEELTSEFSTSKVVTENKEKIEILLKATGNAPILKTKKWMVEKEKTVASIHEFLRKLLKLDPSDSLFLYVNQAFAPPPDQTMKNLYDCYNTDGRLVLHYCKTQAWGFGQFEFISVGLEAYYQQWNHGFDLHGYINRGICAILQ